MTELELPMRKPRQDATLRIDDGGNCELCHRYPDGQIPSEGTILYSKELLEAPVGYRTIDQYTEFVADREKFESTVAGSENIAHLRVVVIDDDGSTWAAAPDGGHLKRYGRMNKSVWSGYIENSDEHLKVKRTGHSTDRHRTYTKRKLRIEREFLTETHPEASVYVVTWSQSFGSSSGSRGNDPSSHHNISGLSVTKIQPNSNE